MVDPSPPNAEKLAEFFQSTERQITPELTEVLEVVATSGKVWHDWEHLKALVSVQMDAVLETYNKSRLAVDVGPPRPLLGGESLEGLQQRLHALLEAIPGPPFTIQRLCEVLLWPHETYASIDKLALAIEKLMMVTQTIARSTDPYPPLPLPPHQPPLPRKTPPQPMQPRLSFGHQPHPEANPDQLEEHELNLHQNQNHQGNHHVHRNDGEQKPAMPSFLEAVGPVPRHLEDAAPTTALENAFGGVETRGNSPPPFGAASQSSHVEPHGPSDGAGRKRSFEETTRQGEGFSSGHSGVIVNPGLQDGVFAPVGHQAMDVDGASTLLPGNGTVIDAPLAESDPSKIEPKVAGTNLETLIDQAASELAGAGHVHLPRGENHFVDEASVSNVVLPLAAEGASADPSIEPMTPPSVVKDSVEARTTVAQPEEFVERTNQEGKVGEPIVKESDRAV